MTVAQKSRLAAQAERKERLEAAGQLASGVAHDLNNFMQVINGYASLASADLPADHPVQSYLAQVLRAGARATQLGNQLLSISRRQALDLECLDVNLILANQIDHLRQICGDDIRVRMHPQADPGLVEADSGSIEQIVLTLCLNARDAMPDGGVLTLRTENVEPDPEIRARHDLTHPGQYVLIEVCDTGGGIDPSTIERVLEPFFTTKPAGQGTGLGLAAVHGLIKQHRGAVLCSSEMGRGTVFQVFLPEA